MENDIFADFEATPSAVLRGLAMAALRIKQEIDGLESLLSERKAALQDIVQKRMIDAMAACGVTELKLDDGTKFAIRPFVSGSLPKVDDNSDAQQIAARELAIGWLVDNGAENLIKTNVTAFFERTQHNVACDFFETLKRDGYTAKLDCGVNTATYQAWAREAIRNGEQLPLELLGLNAGQYVKITPAKGR